MKVRTNLKSGNAMDDALTIASNISDQVSNFFSAAQEQAEDLISGAANSMSSFKQGFSDLLGLA